MPEVRSMVIALVFAALAATVFVGAVTTSEARFVASTENTSNLWEAAELSLKLDGKSSDTEVLFLDEQDLYPGREISNCIVVSTESSLDVIDVRLHATAESNSPLAQYFDVLIERSDTGGCTGFGASDVIYRGTLAELLTRHGKFDDGLSISTEPGIAVDLRLTGSIQDTNDAQGLSLDYVVFAEARP